MMRKILSVFFIAAIMFACKTEKKEQPILKEIAPVSDQMMETAVIYEANIRQYSKEGTFEQFTKDIPQLKELGIKVIWLMPIFPISETKRKATGGANSKFASDFPKEEQSKYLGSYYAVSDFTKINPEFGTIKDFRKLVETAHENDMYVILDWVPNHTGWDHTWLKTNPEYYTQNEKGEVIHPKNTDWTDVADLNYDNKELRKAMVNDMLYWITKEGVDGFRCDVAGSVPTDFWQEAIPKLRAKKDLFMLAEAWEPALLEDGLFDMAYGWDRHHTMNHMAKGEKAAVSWEQNFAKDTARYVADDILMTFVTNHDENSWNGTIKERLGDSWEAMTALSYLAPGMPLIYSGQEYGLSHRLKFFEKDEIPHTKGKEWELLKKLAELKRTNIALHGGKKAASYKTLSLGNDNVVGFKRVKEGSEVVFIANFSKEASTISTVLKGEYLDYLTGRKIDISTIKSLKSNEYKILIKS